MTSELSKTLATLKAELGRLESQVQELEVIAVPGPDPCPRIESLAVVPVLPPTAEIRRRLDIRFAERVQDAFGPALATQILATDAGAKEGLLGESSIVDVGGVNVHVHTGAGSTSSTGVSVIPCGKQQDLTYQAEGAAVRFFWTNLEQAEVQGHLDAIRKQAEEDAMKKAREHAEAEARKAACSGGDCAAGTRCPTLPAALIHAPTVVSSASRYSDTEGKLGTAGSSVRGTATAQCIVTYSCACM